MVNAGGGFHQRGLGRVGDLLVVANRIFDRDLLLRGTLANAYGCRGAGQSGVICLDAIDSQAGRVLLFDTGTTTQVADFPFTRAASGGNSVLVPGVAGQVVLRQGIDHPARRSAQQLLLLGHDSLP